MGLVVPSTPLDVLDEMQLTRADVHDAVVQRHRGVQAGHALELGLLLHYKLDGLLGLVLYLSSISDVSADLEQDDNATVHSRSPSATARSVVEPTSTADICTVRWADKFGVRFPCDRSTLG